MTDTAQEGYCVEYKPTRSERFWRKLGFRFHLGNDDDSPDDPKEGWMLTETLFRFSVLDRFRLLLTGRLKVRVTNDLDVPSPKNVKTRIDWQIYAPGEPR